MSTYQGMLSATTETYHSYAGAIAVAPEPVTPAEERPKPVRRSRRPEFYKPFHYLLLVYLYFYCSRIPELVRFLHVGLVLQPILLAGMIMTGTSKAILRSPIGRFMIAFTIWVAICVPFSVWRGGSFQILLLSAQALGLMFFMAAFIRTLDDCYRAIYVMALALATVGVLSLVIGGGARLGDPRLGLGRGNDTLSDANILALYLVIGMPLLWFASTVKSGVMKIGLIGMMLPALAALGKTGSRMGLVALALAILFFLAFASASQRAVIILAGFVGLVVASSLLPQRIIDRFTTVLQAGDTAASAEAAESAAARKIMFKRSLEMTAEHPFLGVGPGEFMDAEAQEAMEAGRRGLWRYTHNAYTEVSSETGIPGLVLFVTAFYYTYKGLSRYRSRYPNPRVRRAALCVQIAVVVTAIGAFFLSIAYSGILYAIMGLSAAFQLAAASHNKLTKAGT